MSHSPDDMQRLNNAEVDRLMAQVELDERNAQALADWHQRRTSAMSCIDAWPPQWRERLTSWFEEQRDIALRWMFKNRCTRHRHGMPVRLTLFLRQQAE